MSAEDRNDAEVTSMADSTAGLSVTGKSSVESFDETMSTAEMAAMIKRLLAEKIEENKEKERLKAENKEKDEKIKAKEEENKEKDEKIKAKDVLLEAKDAVITQKDAENKKLIEEIKYKDECASIESVWNTFHGFPPMKVNSDARPSARETSRAQSNIDEGAIADGDTGRGKKRQSRDGSETATGPQKKAFSRHEAARAKNLQPSLSEHIKDMVVNYKDRDGSLLKSGFSSEIGRWNERHTRKLSNFNEASPALYMHIALKDLINCLGLSGILETGMEVSIFSLRPDIIAVRYSTQIILVLEIKNPGSERNDAVTIPVALGQQYDYAMGMRRMGIDIPFVVLTTYTRLQVGTLNPDVTDTVKKALQRLKEGNGEWRIRQEEPKKPNVSPEKKGACLDRIPDDSIQDLPEDTKQDEIENKDEIAPKSERHIFISDVFENTDLVKALYLSIACGLVSAEETTGIDRRLVPDEGEEFSGDFGRVKVDGFTWTTHCARRATYALKRNWRKDQIVFLHAVLGIGGSGKVYLCSDTQGRMFATKLYLHTAEVMSNYDPQENQKAFQDAGEKAEAHAQRERKIWTELYPEYAKSVYVSKLFDTVCVMMPVVAPIPHDRRREKGMIVKIRTEMTRIAQIGYVYENNDLRWRHFGLRKRDREERVVFVDLASLTRHSLGEAELQDLLSQQMSELWRRAGTDVVPAPSGLIGGKQRLHD